MWLDLLIGLITSIGGELDVHDLGFEPSLIWTPKPLHRCSIGYQPCTTLLIAFLQVNREHKQERDESNLKLQLYMEFSKLIRGSSIDLKGLVNTSEQDQEKGPWFTTVHHGDTKCSEPCLFHEENKNATKPKP